MRDFIKHALRGALFTIGLVALLLVSSIVLMPKTNAKTGGMQDPAANGILSEPAGTIDVLILGDSETYCSMIPLKMWEQYGITSYCCGTSSQKLSYSQEFLYKAFKRQTPKVVILETNAIFREVSFSSSLLHRADLLFPVFTYHNRWKSLQANDLSFSVNYTYIDDAKGYRFSTLVAPASAEGYMKPSDECASVPARNRSYVESIRAYCEERGARLILVSTPSTKNWTSARHNGIQKLAGELGLEYIDMNVLREQIPIDWNRDTRDKGDHMNFFGAKKVTSYLGGYLAESGLLAGHRGDKSYAHWDGQLENFNKSISASLAQ